MGFLFAILILVMCLAIYDAIREVNKNILKQTEAIKKLHEHLGNNSEE